MNREALEHLFEQLNASWSDLSERDDVADDGYLLRTNTLQSEILSEISACGASIESYPGEWFRVYDDE